MKCTHGKQIYICKDCNGSQICIHNKRKSICRICMPLNFCIHNIDKYVCKDCNGKSICIHNIKKHYCVACGGGSICIHNKIKSDCNNCSKSKFCIHDKIKTTCKDCNGGSICIHDKQRRYCKICNFKNYCEHDKRKDQCKVCSIKICIHNKRKVDCYDCKKINICIHNKKKSRCKLCGGNDLCKSEWCETTISSISKNKYDGYCLFCFVHLFPEKPITRNYKTKEFEVVKFIKNIYPDFSWITDKTIKDGCSKKRPDLLLDLGYQVIIIEIDENQHTSYDCSCENKRIMELSQDIGHRPIIFIRFNPDDYMDEDNNSIKSCWHINKTGFCQINKTKIDEWEFRLDILKQQIDYWIIPENKTEKTIEIVELFYDKIT